MSPRSTAPGRGLVGSLGCLLALGCSGPGASLEYERQLATCAGEHEGAFSGDDDGDMTASLAADGTLTVSFQTSFGDLHASGYVDASGIVTGEHEGVVVVGVYDFDRCEAAGTWRMAGFGADGEWSITRL